MEPKQFSSPVEPNARCSRQGCAGARFDGDKCFVHTTNDERQRDVLRRILEAPELEQRDLDLRGVVLRGRHIQLLAQELKDATLGNLQLSNATIEGRLDLLALDVVGSLALDGVDCHSDFTLRQCKVRQLVLMGARFAGLVRLGSVEVTEELMGREVRCEGPVFGGEHENSRLRCKGKLDFIGAQFAGPVDFGGTRVEGRAAFSRAAFGAAAYFRGFEVDGEFSLHGCEFSGDLYLASARVSGYFGLVDARAKELCFFSGLQVGHASFRRASFSRAPDLGPFSVGRWLVLDQAVFDEPVRIIAVAGTTHAHRVVFRHGVSLQLRGDLLCDGTAFAESSELSAAPGPLLLESAGQPEVEVPSPDFKKPLRLLSLRGTDVGGLAVSFADLRCCLLADAHRLDQLRIGPGVAFATAPSPLLARREVIAEEEFLRSAEKAKIGKWRSAETLVPNWLRNAAYPDDASEPLRVRGLRAPVAAQIAEVYRQLRKAREDASDYPGGADFYYGEMEMRRRDAHDRSSWGEQGTVAAWVERAVLDAYWLTSGYGLRAWRSVATLLLLLLVATCALNVVGYVGQAPPLDETARFAISTSLSLLRPIAEGELTCVGFGIAVALKLVGPATLALIVLSIRSRVRR